MRHVDLCSGVGGFAYAFETVGLSKPVLFCDIEPWSRQVLAKHWPDVPISDDVKELASDPRRLVPDCDILTAGYPCQPFSLAGKRRGEKDDRHIWPEIFAIVQAKRPRWCVFENVSGHINMGLDQVLSDLADKAGYEVQTFCVGAVAVDAPHRRQRVWIIAAHADSHGQPDGTINEKQGCWQLGASNVGNSDSSQCCWDIEATEQGGRQQAFAARRENVADASSAGLQRAVRHGQAGTQGIPSGHIAECSSDVADADSQRGCGRDAKRQDASDAGKSPGHQRHDTRGMEKRQPLAFMGGMVDGLSTRLDGFDGWEREPKDIPRVTTGIKQRAARLKGLGNAIVPAIAMRIGQTIKAVEDGQV